MLQTQTVAPGALDILKKLMRVPALSDFFLVGGSALSLQFGHRRSNDLDLFSSENFDNESIVRVIEKEFVGFAYRNVTNPIGLFGYIDNVKVDFVKYYHHPLIQAAVFSEGIRFMSTPDIIAMK